MNPRTKTYLKVGIGLAVTGVVVYFAYKFIDKKITEAKIRKDKAKADAEKPPQTQPGQVKPEEIVAVTGKTAYPKGDYVNVRSDASVDNGWFNNFIGKVLKNTPVGKVLEGNIQGDGKVWYKVGVIGANLKDDANLGKAKKNSTTGYVREDAVTIK